MTIFYLSSVILVYNVVDFCILFFPYHILRIKVVINMYCFICTTFLYVRMPLSFFLATMTDVCLKDWMVFPKLLFRFHNFSVEIVEIVNCGIQDFILSIDSFGTNFRSIENFW